MDQILIGQKAQGNVIITGNVQIQSRVWMIEGGSFSSYDIGQYYGRVQTATNLSASQPVWFWRRNGDHKVKCSVMLIVDGEPFGPILLEKTIRATQPTITVTASTGTVGYIPGGIASGGDGIGILLIGRATVPNAFVSGSDHGQLAWTQLCNLDRWQRYGLGAYVKETKTNGFVNDHGWTYSGPGSAAQPLAMEDSPWIGFNTGVTAFRINDYFKAYLMFKPPGAQSQWVPLQRVDWEWIVPLTGLPFPNPIPNAHVSVTKNVREYFHPLWEGVYYNNQGVITGSDPGTGP